MREFDENGDGRIDAKDSIYPRLRVWLDRNHNGVSEPDELVPLADAGIDAILTAFTSAKRVDEYGNRYSFEGTALVARTAGRDLDRRIFDVFLASAP